MGDVIKELREAVLTYDSAAAVQAAKKTIQMGIDPVAAIEKGLAEGIRSVGDRYERGEAFLYHLAIAAEVMNAAMAILKPELKRRESHIKKLGRVVLGTVEGDIHDIGKNILKALLVTNGFEVFDLGKDVPTVKFVEKAEEIQADIVAVSALLTVTRIKQKEIIDALKNAGIREKVKVLVGGAAVDEKWAKSIGADGFGQDAVQGVKIARKLMEHTHPSYNKKSNPRTESQADDSE